MLGGLDSRGSNVVTGWRRCCRDGVDEESRVLSGRGGTRRDE
jgi:hypothetical protein